MKNIKKIIAIGTLITSVGLTSVTAFAASNYSSPAELVAQLTGRTVESVTTEHVDNNKTYGSIAKDSGKLDEFKTENIEMKKDALNKKVAAGTMSQEDANKAIKTIEENQSNCDGSGSSSKGKGLGTCKGNGFRSGSCLSK